MNWESGINKRVINHPNQILEPDETVTFDENERQIHRASLLKKMVPILTVIVLLSLILFPILASRENSFTLAIDLLEKRDEKAKILAASYVDVDRNNNPIYISAEAAYREENETTDYFFTNLIAKMSLLSGQKIEINASKGILSTNTQVIDLGGEIIITSENGLLLRATEAKFSIADKIAIGENGVTGIAPFGRFSSQSFSADVEQETVTLDGNVKINFDPNKPLNIFSSSPNTIDNVTSNTEGNIN